MTEDHTTRPPHPGPDAPSGLPGATDALAGDPATDGTLPVTRAADTGAGPGSPALARPGVPRA